jgi:hypothetical protein
MLYLANKEEKKKGLAPGDPQSIRRQLRRVNWIARKLIKKYKKSANGISMDKLTTQITNLLDQYQVKTLGWKKPDKTNTGYEARVIGNLLLPPTIKKPQGKSVFMAPGMDPNANPEDGATKTKTIGKRTKPSVGKAGAKTNTKVEVSAEDLHNRFEVALQYADAFFDTDLKDVIMGHAEKGHSIKAVVDDVTIRDIYDTSTVRQVIKGLIKSGKIEKDSVSGALSVNDKSDWLSSKITNSRAIGDDESVGTEEIPMSDKESRLDPEETDEENVDETIPDAPSWDRLEKRNTDEEEGEEFESENRINLPQSRRSRKRE